MIDINDMFDGCYLRHTNGTLHGPFCYDSRSGLWKCEDLSLSESFIKHYSEILSVQISKPNRKIKDGDIVKLRNGVILGEVKKDGVRYLVFEYPDFIKELWYANGRKSNEPKTLCPKDIVAVLDKNTSEFIEV